MFTFGPTLQYQLQGTVVVNIAIFDAQDLHQPRVTIEFSCHRLGILSHLVARSSTGPVGPGSQAPAGGEGAFGMSPQQFQEFINTMRGGHTTPAPATDATGTGTVDRRWSINLESLMKLINVSDIQHLPLIWAAIAKGPH